MNTDIVNALTHRLELVHRRIDALNKEAETLTTECDSLSSLLDVYISRKGYDPIEEERRVTERMLKTTITSDITPAAPKRHGAPRNTDYDAIFELIFEENGNTPLNLTALTAAMNSYTEHKIIIGTVQKLIQPRLDTGLLAIVRKVGVSKYYACTKFEVPSNES